MRVQRVASLDADEQSWTVAGASGEPVTYARIAAAADVSRSWLYTQPEGPCGHRPAPRSQRPIHCHAGADPAAKLCRLPGSPTRGRTPTESGTQR
jgi:hypothetical protein